MAEHSTLTGSDLHEPKGVAAAAVDTVYVADGAGSGTHSKVTASVLDTATILDSNRFWLNVRIPDISTANTIYVPVGYTSAKTITLIGAVSVLEGSIATANANITFRNSSGTAMGGAMVVAYSGSAAGDVDTFTPSSNQTFATGAAMRIETDGASTNTVPLSITLEFTIG